MEHQISAVIRDLKASAETRLTITPLPSAEWNRKWLNLRTHHPKLAELERETGRFCFDMARSPLAGRLLLLSGESGSGKTHCAKAVREWIRAAGGSVKFIRRVNHVESLSCVFWHWPALLDTLKNGGWDVVEDMMETPCLIIDELGGGHDPSAVGTDKLCQILSRRERRWTLVTTNIVQSAWEEKFDRRVASRFFRNSTHVDLSAVPDFSLHAA